MIEAKQFNGLSQKDKIMEVANDVIASIEMKRFRVNVGTFVSFDKTAWDERKEKTDLWSELPALMQSCECCALGACILSFSRFQEEFKPTVVDFEPDYEGDTRLRLITSNWTINRIEALFGMRMTQMVEVAFELGEGYWLDHKGEDDPEEGEVGCILDENTFAAAVAFGKQYPDNEHRMKAIMANILQNKGDFVPGPLV